MAYKNAIKWIENWDFERKACRLNVVLELA